MRCFDCAFVFVFVFVFVLIVFLFLTAEAVLVPNRFFCFFCFFEKTLACVNCEFLD
jgi:hypothetical protein